MEALRLIFRIPFRAGLGLLDPPSIVTGFPDHSYQKCLGHCRSVTTRMNKTTPAVAGALTVAGTSRNGNYWAWSDMLGTSENSVRITGDV